MHISTRGAAAALRPPPHSSVLATDADIPKLNKDPVKSIRPSCRMCGKNGHSESACSHNEGATCPQRLGLEVVPVDNDSSGGDKAHDLLRNDFYSDLPRRAQRGEFLVIWAAPPCSTFSICRLGDGVAPTKRSWKRHCLADVFAHDAAYCALYVGG